VGVRALSVQKQVQDVAMRGNSHQLNNNKADTKAGEVEAMPLSLRKEAVVVAMLVAVVVLVVAVEWHHSSTKEGLLPSISRRGHLSRSLLCEERHHRMVEWLLSNTKEGLRPSISRLDQLSSRRLREERHHHMVEWLPSNTVEGLLLSMLRLGQLSSREELHHCSTVEGHLRSIRQGLLSISSRGERHHRLNARVVLDVELYLLPLHLLDHQFPSCTKQPSQHMGNQLKHAL
jgi:hypothetical protein